MEELPIATDEADEQFKLIQEVLHNLERAEGQELRGCPRHPFQVTQPVAPFDGSQDPSTAVFRLVRCNDISQSGISFYWPCPPDFTRALLALGTPENRIFMAARVVRHVARPGNEFLIGCVFIERVEG